jgi:hypothetical protein
MLSAMVPHIPIWVRIPGFVALVLVGVLAATLLLGATGAGGDHGRAGDGGDRGAGHERKMSDHSQRPPDGSHR